VADIKSESRPASNRNRWPASYWNAWPASSESAAEEIAKEIDGLFRGDELTAEKLRAAKRANNGEMDDIPF
jgi:hypothetical protein